MTDETRFVSYTENMSNSVTVNLDRHGEARATKTEDGVAYPASDYCYVPDAAAPSTWKLRVTDHGQDDTALVSAAAAALSTGGFRGNPVQLPAADRSAVVACVRRAWKSAYPDRMDMPVGIRSEDDVEEARSLMFEASDIEVRDAMKREVDVRLLPWGKQIDTKMGPEEFRKGAFDGTDPSTVYLFGAEHEMRFGLGQDGSPKPVRVPVGRAIALGEDEIGPKATFRVARTSGGDEALALMADKIISGVSVEFSEVPGGTLIENRNGRRVRVHTRARLMGATPTHRPAYGDQATVLAVRSLEEVAPMGEGTEIAPVAGPVEDTAVRVLAAIEAVETRAKAQDAVNQKFLERMDRFEENARASFEVPNPSPEPDKPRIHKGEWIQIVTRILTGERIPDQQLRSLEDVITTDNAGVVPPAFLTELIGVIDNSRPFMQTTRRLPTPASGMKLTVPVITQRPEVGIQAHEKDDIASRATKITAEDFNAVTIAGGGDLSLQIIKRSSPDFLSLWVELLAEAYAIEAEDVSVLALLDSIGGVGAASALNPNNLALGDAFVTSFDAIRRPPDTIWLSTKAVGEFIDAKATTTNQPLYPGLAASATAAGGITGVISGLRPVHVPALDAHGAYAIVGPSSGFAWAEDGTYTLQVDVPSKAGRDVALVGILWPAPWYPAAFTAYNVAS
jgi:HK97 family phage major capsid protein